MPLIPSTLRVGGVMWRAWFWRSMCSWCGQGSSGGYANVGYDLHMRRVDFSTRNLGDRNANKVDQAGQWRRKQRIRRSDGSLPRCLIKRSIFFAAMGCSGFLGPGAGGRGRMRGEKSAVRTKPYVATRLAFSAAKQPRPSSSKRFKSTRSKCQHLEGQPPFP